MGEQGPQGETGPQGPQGERGCPGPQGEQGPAGPTGATGAKGDPGLAGPAGEKGATGATGATGPAGEKGATGATGPAGEKGETGPAGPAPEISVTENTPTAYRLTFRTSAGEVLSPNLKSNIEAYNYDISKAGSSASIPLGKLTLIAQYNSSAGIRLLIALQSGVASVLADIRRTTIYGLGTIETQTWNNTQINSQIVIDDLVYSDSQETHFLRIRQQDPATKLWSLCDVEVYPSAFGARTSVCVEWMYTGASFSIPS